MINDPPGTVDLHIESSFIVPTTIDLYCPHVPQIKTTIIAIECDLFQCFVGIPIAIDEFPNIKRRSFSFIFHVSISIFKHIPTVQYYNSSIEHIFYNLSGS